MRVQRVTGRNQPAGVRTGTPQAQTHRPAHTLPSLHACGVATVSRVGCTPCMRDCWRNWCAQALRGRAVRVPRAVAERGDRHMRRALQQRRRRASAVRACGSAELAAPVARHILCVLLIVGRQPDARKQAVQPQRLRLGRRHGRPGPLLGGRCCGRGGLRCGRAPVCDHRGLVACARALHGSG